MARSLRAGKPFECALVRCWNSERHRGQVVGLIWLSRAGSTSRSSWGVAALLFWVNLEGMPGGRFAAGTFYTSEGPIANRSQVTNLPYIRFRNIVSAGR